MKRIIKSIWVSKLTLVLTVIQLVMPIIFGTNFWSISLFISITINFLAMILISYNIWWFLRRGQKENAESYRRDAPCIFQAIKFAMGIIISSVLAIVCTYKKLDWINVEQVLITWYFLPLVLVFVTIAFLDAGFYIEKGIKGKSKSVIIGLKKLLFIMFDVDKDNKIIISVRGVLSTVALLIMFVILVLYSYGKISNIL